MSRRWPTDRGDEEDEPASGDVSRFLVMGFLIASGLGLAAGLGWVSFNLLRRQFGG